MKLKVKDLRDYLHLHEVPTQMCREKEELVELVLGQQTPSSDASTPSDTHAHTPLPEQETISEPTIISEQPSTESDVMNDLTSHSQTAGDEQVRRKPSMLMTSMCIYNKLLQCIQF